MNISDLFAAWASHQYLLFTAIIVGAVVAAAKQGWLGDWIAAHLPPSSRPYLAMTLGFLGTVAAGLLAHPPLPLMQAILAGVNGVIAGALAIAGHQVVIEGWRKGTELVPKAPPNDPSATP